MKKGFAELTSLGLFCDDFKDGRAAQRGCESSSGIALESAAEHPGHPSGRIAIAEQAGKLYEKQGTLLMM